MLGSRCHKKLDQILALVILVIYSVSLQSAEGQFGVLDDLSDDELNKEPPPFVAWNDLPRTRRMLGANCSHERYIELGVASWWSLYFNDTELPDNHPLQISIAAGNGTSSNGTMNPIKPTTPAPQLGANGTITGTTPPVVEPRIDNRPLREKLDELCFLEEEEHEYLYACSEDQMCVCLSIDEVIVTTSINTGNYVQCVIGEGHPCVSPKRPDKPYPCHRKFWCDVNDTKLCQPCETHPDPATKTCFRYRNKNKNVGSERVLNWFLLVSVLHLQLLV